MTLVRPTCKVSPQIELTRIKRGLQRLDVSCDAGHSVDSHLLHPSALDLLHTLSHNEGNFGALSPGEDKF